MSAAYPPDTHRFLSWAAIQFIQRPSWRPLAWVCCALLGTVLAGSVMALYLRLDIRVAGNGVVAADPGVLRVVAKAGGTLSAPKFLAGSRVAAGQILATLETGMDESRLESVLRGLERNVQLVGRASRQTGLVPEVENGRALAELNDDEVRRAATVLQLSLDRLRGALASETPFLSLRDDAVQASSLLRSALIGYMERQRVRAPSAGMLIQYEVPAHGSVKPGDVIAILLPGDARLVARLILEPRDVASIQVGQEVYYQVEAYPFQRYGLFEGKVLAIEQAPPGPDQSLRYLVRAAIHNPPHLSPRLADTVRLVMGMKVRGEIITGRRPLFDLAADALLGGA